MSDKLKDFIRNNRDEFDNREPSDRVWKGIEKEIGDKRYLMTK